MSENRQRDLTPTEAAERFIAKRRNKNTEKTVRSYENRLRQFVRWAHERDDVETMRDLDGWIIDEYERFLDERGDAPATVQGKLVALNELVKYCVRLDVVDADLPQRVEIPNLSKDDQTSDKMLEAPDARRLLQYYRNSTKDYGTRHHVTLELMWHVGGRISCFLALDLEDYDADEQVLRFRHRPPTRLKDGTDHERNVALTDATADALDFWIARERYDKKDENGRTPLLTTAQGAAGRVDTADVGVSGHPALYGHGVPAQPQARDVRVHAEVPRLEVPEQSVPARDSDRLDYVAVEPRPQLREGRRAGGVEPGDDSPLLRQARPRRRARSPTPRDERPRHPSRQRGWFG